MGLQEWIELRARSKSATAVVFKGATDPFHADNSGDTDNGYPLVVGAGVGIWLGS
jgi:hypothetical protein